MNFHTFASKSIPVIIIILNVQVIVLFVVVLVITLLETDIAFLQSTKINKQILNIYVSN